MLLPEAELDFVDGCSLASSLDIASCEKKRMLVNNDYVI